MNSSKIQYINGRVFTSDAWLNGACIHAENRLISSVTETGTADQVVDLKGRKMVPAFIDLQIYGGNGMFFGENPTVAALEATVAYSRAGGANLIFPTVATNSNEVAFAAIAAVSAYWKKGGTGVGGLHLEGPFLNEKKRGAHALDKIQEPTVENIRKLVDRGRGVVKIMTIAPELFSPEGIEILQEAGIIISAGHSDASYQQANEAFDRGIKVCTHLFNAMSAMMHRAPGLVGAILDHATVMSSIVPDGNHVDAAVIRLAKKLMGPRLFIITDAVTENPDGHYQHRLAGDKYIMPDGTLSGSALTMEKAVRFCIDRVGIAESEALRMASLYPATVIGLDKTWGRIAPGYLANNYWIM